MHVRMRKKLIVYVKLIKKCKETLYVYLLQSIRDLVFSREMLYPRTLFKVINKNCLNVCNMCTYMPNTHGQRIEIIEKIV